MRIIQKKTSTFEIVIFRAAAKHRAIHYIFAATGLFFSTQSRFLLLLRNLEVAAKDAAPVPAAGMRVTRRNRCNQPK